MTSRQNQDESVAEKLFLEQARAYYCDLQATGGNAPYGKGLQRAEALALLRGRELVRQSLELAAQENIEEIEKNETRRCSCGGRRKHRGYKSKQTVSAVGVIESKRLYRTCPDCRESIYPADLSFGLKNRYTIRARQLAFLAGTSWPFDKAVDHLERVAAPCRK